MKPPIIQTVLCTAQSAASHVATLSTHLTLACVVAALASAAEPTKPDPDPARFKQEIEAFEAWDRQNSFPPDAVLFVGSSSIRLWQTADCFPEVPLINRGFGGSQTSDVNHFAERIVLNYKPRLIVFYAGDNDIESGKPPQQVFDDFQAFTRLVHNELPQARIAYLPIKPSIARWTKWPSMQEVNAQVVKLSNSDSRILFVDTATPMLGADGKPRKELFLDDGLHLNDKGYAVWSKFLAPVLHKSAQPAAQ